MQHMSLLSSVNDENLNVFPRPKFAQDWEDNANLYAQLQMNGAAKQMKTSEVDRWIHDLNNTSTRARAINFLSKSRERIPELGLLLWHSFGAISSLIQEIIISYAGPTNAQGNELVCDVLSLLQSIAEHPRARIYFVCSNLHEIIAPIAKQGKTDEYTELQRTKALQIFCCLVDPATVDGRLWAREHSLIVRQIMANQSLMPIIWNSARFGQRESMMLIIQLLEQLFAQYDILVLLLQTPQNLERLVKVLDHLQNFCLTFAPNLSSTISGFKASLLPFVESTHDASNFSQMSGADPGQDQFFQKRPL